MHFLWKTCKISRGLRVFTEKAIGKPEKSTCIMHFLWRNDKFSRGLGGFTEDTENRDGGL